MSIWKVPRAFTPKTTLGKMKMWLISQFLFNHLVLWYLRSSRMLGRKIRGVVHQIREGRKVQKTGTHKGTSTNAVTPGWGRATIFVFRLYNSNGGILKPLRPLVMPNPLSLIQWGLEYWTCSDFGWFIVVRF